MVVAASPRSRAQVAAVLAFVISHTTSLAAQDDETGRCPLSVFKPQISFPSANLLPFLRNAIQLSGKTFLAPHRGSCPEGLCKRTGFLGVKRRENPVRRHFERNEMRGSTTVYPTLFDDRWYAPIAFGTSPEGGSKTLRS